MFAGFMGVCVLVPVVSGYFIGYCAGFTEGSVARAKKTIHKSTSFDDSPYTGVDYKNLDLYRAEQCFLSSYQVSKALVASRGYEAVGSESVEEMYKRCFGAMYKPPVNPYTKN